MKKKTLLIIIIIFNLINIIPLYGLNLEKCIFFTSDKDNLAIGEIIFKDKNFREEIPFSLVTLNYKKENITSLYSITNYDNNLKKVKVLFRINRTQLLKLKDKKSVKINLITNFGDRYSYYSKRKFNHKLTIDNNIQKFNKKKRVWLKQFKNLLEKNFKNYSIDDIERILYIRWFNKLPPENHSWRYSKNIFDEFFKPIMGISDIEDAIPFDKKNKIISNDKLVERPEPILLPEVITKKIKLEASKSPLSLYIPRSCYYIEFPSFEKFDHFFKYLSVEYDKWAPHSFPKNVKEIIKDYYLKIGFTKEYIEKNLKNNVENMVLSGWDFYFESGTNILIVMKCKKKINLPQNIIYKKELKNNIYIFSTGKKLFKMALNANIKHRDLRGENNFRYTRNRLKSDNYQELFFLYLSDYWLTNLISPRWYINTKRINSSNFRIKMINILKEIVKRENSLKKLPTISELKNYKPLKEKWLKYILKDIDEQGVKNVKYGSFYKNIPIDEIKFNKVTKSEYDDYESFKRFYSRRWKAVDPLGIQFLIDNKNKQYISRLYLSPISNISDYRFLRNFVPKKKVVQNFDNIEGCCAGISLAIMGNFIRSMLPVNLPVLVFVKAIAFDFSLPLYTPEYWLKKDRKYEDILYFGLPISVSIPSSILLSSFPVQIETTKSQYDGIDRVNVRNFSRNKESKFFKIYSVIPENSAYRYLGIGPSTLLRIKNSIKEKRIDDLIPSDLRIFIDFKYGYMLRIKFWQELVKNRVLASWEKYQRENRLRAYLGLKKTNKKKNMIIHDFYDENYKRLITSLPNSTKSNSLTWAPSALRYFENLPETFLNILRLDFYTTIEDNGIFIETHYKNENWKEKENREVKGSKVILPQENKRKRQQLDFDE